LAVNVHMLDILGHRISIHDWTPYSKQVIWTACTVCFYSSCRMGELICSDKKFFDKHTTVMWENVKFLDDKECVILIPFTKTTGFDGCIIDVFPLKNDNK